MIRLQRAINLASPLATAYVRIVLRLWRLLLAAVVPWRGSHLVRVLPSLKYPNKDTVAYRAGILLLFFLVEEHHVSHPTQPVHIIRDVTLSGFWTSRPWS